MTHTPLQNALIYQELIMIAVDNDFTPFSGGCEFILGYHVPVEYVKDGQIVLNLSAGATGNL